MFFTPLLKNKKSYLNSPLIIFFRKRVKQAALVEQDFPFVFLNKSPNEVLKVMRTKWRYEIKLICKGSMKCNQNGMVQIDTDLVPK